MTQPSWIGRELGGRYRIDELIGQGGMSSVYKVTDPNLKRVVAVKMIHQHLSGDPEFVRRFESEAAAVAQLRHPNIIQVFDFDHEGDTYYMVVEFIPGESLQERLRRLTAAGRKLSLEEIRRFAAGVCDGVDYAHKRGLVHRDVKPANVMLNVHGDAILMDFGIAKIVGETQYTAVGAVLGTALYMAPEQIRGERPDQRVDIYSLGVMLFEMVSGRRPFEGDSAMTVMMMHINDPVPDLREISPDTPAPLVAIIEKALDKNPDGRFQSAAEMAAELRSLPGASAVPDGGDRRDLAATVIQGAQPVPPPLQPGDQPTSPASLEATLPDREAAVPTETGRGEPPPPPPPTDTGERGDPPSRVPRVALIAAGGLGGILVVVVLAVLLAGVFSGGDDDGGDALGGSTATATPTSTSPTATPAPTDPAGPAVRINGITVQDGLYVVEYETFGYQEALPGRHVHFFFDTVSPENAGVPGPGPWILYGGPRPFTGYGVADRPPEAERMCSLVANEDHSVIQDTGNCAPLPEGQ
jgi:serine/threonine-protein kinase